MTHNLDQILIYGKLVKLQYYANCTDNIIDFFKNQVANTATFMRQVFCLWLVSEGSIADK